MADKDLNPAADAAEDNREPFAAFVMDDQTASVITPIIEEYGWERKRVQRGTIETAIRALGIMEPPKLLVVDLEKSKKPIEEITALSEICGMGTYIIALGETNDVQLYRELIASGVNDYILKPVLPETISAAITKGFLSFHEKETSGPSGPCKMLTIIGVRGGVGSSLLATNTAWIIANEYKRSTALLDLDIHFGTSALTFDLEPGRGLADALEDPTRVDDLFVERAMIKVNDTLSILGSEMPFEDTFYPDATALNHLINTLKSKVAFLIVDLPRGMAGEHSHLLEESTDIILISELALAATRDTIRFLGFIKNAAPNAKVHILVNSCHADGAEEVSLKDFEASIEGKVKWIMPMDSKVVMNAVKKGKVLPEVGKDSKLVQTIRSVAQQLTGMKTKPKPKGGSKWSLKKN